MAVVEENEVLQRLQGMAPEELLKWAFDNYGDKAAIITSFQNTGCVMMDMAQRAGASLRVITVDTLRLHPETYEFMKTVESHYGIQIERFEPDPDRLRRMIDQHGEYLFFDSKERQEFCCQIRKVEPNERALATVDVWFTGLRRDQSEFRKDTELATWIDAPGDEGRKILKISPLASWSDEHVRGYLKDHKVPYSPLYDQGYTSIGCTICTTPTKPWEKIRDGRWRWFNDRDDDKECGIHFDGSGI